jgi:hypothetical protein
MISVKFGNTKVEGSKEEIFADISTIASYAYEHLAKQLSKEEAQEKIMLAVERGFLISCEMDSQTAYEMQKLTKKINER